MRRKPPKGYAAGGAVGSIGSGLMQGIKTAKEAWDFADGFDSFGDTKKKKDADPGTLKEGVSSSPGGSKDATTGKARGGPIRRVAGKPIGKDDGLIPAQRGEYVVRRSAVKKLGEKALNTINKGKLPGRDSYAKKGSR